MSRDELLILRDSLGRGYGKVLAERTGKSINAVYRALNPDDELESETIVNAAIQYAMELQELRDAIKSNWKKVKEGVA